MNQYIKTIVILLICLGVVPFARAQAPWQNAAQQPVLRTVADEVVRGYRFETHHLDSKDGQRHYKIYIAIPQAAPPPEGYASLYLLDGNAVMASLSSKDIQGLAATDNPPVLVAVGYDIDTRNDVIARSYDYTPPVFQDGKKIAATVRGRLGGGADEFLALMNNVIKPLVQKRVALNVQQQYVWGHSYGGLFVLYALTQSNSGFTRFYAADPSLWWHDEALGPALDHFSLDQRTAARVAVYWGTRQSAPSSAMQAQARTPTATDRTQRVRRLLERLQQAQWQVSYEAFPQYGHGDMIMASLRRTLQSMSDPH